MLSICISSHANHLRANFEEIRPSDLSWQDSLASWVIDAESKFVKQLPGYALRSFMV